MILTGELRSAKRQAPRCKTGAPKGRPPQSVSMTDQNASGAVSLIGGRVVAAVVGGGIGSAIGVSRRSRRIGPVPVATAIAIARITIADGAVAVGGGATLDVAKIGLAATLEAMQSASAIETRRTTGDLSRRCTRAATGRKANDRSGRRTTDGRTADA